MGFSKQEYWSGLPSPPPGDLPDPGMALESPRDGLFKTTALPGKPTELWADDFLIRGFSAVKRMQSSSETSSQGSRSTSGGVGSQEAWRWALRGCVPFSALHLPGDRHCFESRKEGDWSNLNNNNKQPSTAFPWHGVSLFLSWSPLVESSQGPSEVSGSVD